MVNPVIYIFINKSLGMSSGKVAAQAAHAMAMAMIGMTATADRDHWHLASHRTVLIMEARDEAHINNIEYYLEERGIPTEKIIDEGVNEIDEHVVTALATCILDRECEEDMLTMSSFKLYRDTVRVTLEIDK